MPGEDGLSERDHLRQVARSLGQDPDSVGPKTPPPVELGYVFAMFVELSAARGSTGFGPETLSFVEIDAWSRLTGTSLEPWEVRLIRDLDHVWLECWSGRANRHSQTQPAD